jgi:hypothetical protein
MGTLTHAIGSYQDGDRRAGVKQPELGRRFADAGYALLFSEKPAFRAAGKGLWPLTAMAFPIGANLSRPRSFSTPWRRFVYLRRAAGIVPVLSLAAATSTETVWSIPLRANVIRKCWPTGVRPTLLRNCVAL